LVDVESRSRLYSSLSLLSGTAYSNPTSCQIKLDWQISRLLYTTLIHLIAMSAEASTSKTSNKTKKSRDREEDESAGEGEASVEVNKNKRHRKEKRESALRVVATC
jgi:hypothetical protein